MENASTNGKMHLQIQANSRYSNIAITTEVRLLFIIGKIITI